MGQQHNSHPAAHVVAAQCWYWCWGCNQHHLLTVVEEEVAGLRNGRTQHLRPLLRVPEKQLHLAACTTA